MIDNEATFTLIERVFHQALLDVLSKDHNRRTAAEHWLDCMAPDWRERRRRCRGRGSVNLYDLSPVDHAHSNVHAPASFDRGEVVQLCSGRMRKTVKKYKEIG